MDFSKLILKDDSDVEPLPDIAKCSKCGFQGDVSKLETATEGDWESGYYDIHLCPKCDDGGCVDDYSMSDERAKELREWHERNRT